MMRQYYDEYQNVGCYIDKNIKQYNVAYDSLNQEKDLQEHLYILRCFRQDD